MHKNLIPEIDKFIENSSTEELRILSVRKIADFFNLNPDYLSRKYKEERNIRLGNVLRNEKMKRAKMLLVENADLSISDLSKLIGYEKQRYFSNIFKNTYGRNPHQFRKILKK